MTNTNITAIINLLDALGGLTVIATEALSEVLVNGSIEGSLRIKRTLENQMGCAFGKIKNATEALNLEEEEILQYAKKYSDIK